MTTQPPAAPESDVNALRGALAAATPGPWVQNDPPRHAKVRTTGLPDDLDDEIATTIEASDATLIVAAVNALPAILDERDRLQRWKDEALPVILGLQDLGKALGLRLGTSITGPDAVEAARALIARAESAEAAHANTEADYDSRGERLWRLAAKAGHVPHESDNDATAELAIADALAAHEALRKGIEALADEWADTPDDRRYDGDRARALRALLAGGEER